jgi:DNA-binding Lrp family transcriptional regulator
MIDQIDTAILALLQEDGKLTIKEIAAQLKLTTTPVFERIKRLERDGHIQRYAALVDRAKVGLSVMAFCSVSLDAHHTEFLEKFEEDIQHFPEVLECYHIAGMFDYLLKVVIKDMEAYHDFVSKKLASLENIGRVQSSFVMTEVKYSTSLQLKK